MRIGNTTTLESIVSGEWFFFGAYMAPDGAYAVVARVYKTTVIDLPGLYEGKMYSFHMYDITTMKYVGDHGLQEAIIEAQVDKGTYREVLFDSEEEKAKLYLVTA